MMRYRALVTISQLETVLTIVPTSEEGIDHIFMEEIEKELKKKQDNTYIVYLI
ncbi:hypothetical protein [Mucilaginibacter humi]|uniref:hypothetical protein n=1 Tax=Mucilaginibacter humi TaxID=2732510 RepID=UPI00293C0FC3|nr:hypothetical protein [Mucilaginibacter humi]